MNSMTEFLSIFAMQGFNGLSLFCVLLLMALGLAIIFGQMGVINMAHGEFMTVGAYTTFVASHVASTYFPALMGSYFLFAIGGAFLIAFGLGYLTEYLMIRHLYRRPLDTLLATWGLSLLFIGLVTTIFGAQTGTTIAPPLGAIHIGDYSLSTYELLLIAITAMLSLAVDRT